MPEQQVERLNLAAYQLVVLVETSGRTQIISDLTTAEILAALDNMRDQLREIAQAPPPREHATHPYTSPRPPWHDGWSDAV